ncbi:DUF2244 domain-containing protein [Pseudomarimonas arenosa]|uniref:DUF2244 domain-containing protein n=1 Tax=Pseudomarimonas arenosa TaxID=2774145 RepID=A0AAW3ZI16_9GAMM|nr:DUF2244 domain-containing protein [Pseudomarimonas arenosa]MBD8525723.1 DUF2244 domain-containing protein [Pseudomarimonas arenosa]
MIEQYAPAADSGEARLVVRPNRSLDPRQLRWISLGLVVLVVPVAVYSGWQGNVFAPAFAVLELIAVIGCMHWVWRQGQRLEVIAVARNRLSVRRLPEMADQFAAHPAWVRLDVEAGRLWLRSGRRKQEIGECLSEHERRTLAERMAELLRWASRPA